MSPVQDHSNLQGPYRIMSIQKALQAGSYPKHDKNSFEGKGSNCKVIIDAILGKACTKTVILA